MRTTVTAHEKDHHWQSRSGVGGEWKQSSSDSWMIVHSLSLGQLANPRSTAKEKKNEFLNRPIICWKYVRHGGVMNLKEKTKSSSVCIT